MSSDSFKTVGDILERILDRAGLSRGIRERKAVLGWDEAVGDRIASHVRPVRVQRGVLWLQADSPQWALEVNLRQRQILTTLNRGVGEELLTALRFVGEWSPQAGHRGR